MANQEAIGWLKYAVPIRAVTSDEFSDFTTAVNMAIDALNPRKGKWIQNDNGTWSCDQCNSWIPNEQHYYANWCLYCGTDMRGEEE